MAVLQRLALGPDERLDLPDERSLEGFSLNDWQYFSSGFLSNVDMIVQGFEISNYANIFLVPGFNLRLTTVTMFHPTSETQAAGFYVTNGEEPDAVVSLSSSATNYVECDFTEVAGTPDVRAFWDPGANSGAGGEFTETVDTANNLTLVVSSNVSGFSAGTVPLYKVVTNSGGVVTSVTDCRPMFFRLGSGGNTPNPANNYAWPPLPDVAHERLETPVTATSATTGNAPFQGGDKNIQNMKQFFDALMTVVKEIKQTPYWYSPYNGTSPSSVYQNAALTILIGGTWEALGLISLSTAATVSTVTVKPGTLFVAGASTFTAASVVYNYTSYSSSTGVFTGVTPDPSALPNGTAVLQGEFGHLELITGSTLYRMGAANNSSLTPFADMDLTAHPDLWVLLPSTDTTIVYGMGQDGTTPVVPQAATVVTTTTVTVPLGGNYATGGGILLMGGQNFTYAAYNSGTGLFTGVSPDPTGSASPGTMVYADNNAGVGYYQISSPSQVPGIIGGVSQGIERVFWLAVYDGSYTIRLREGDLQPGEVINVGDVDIQNIITYIGSSGPSDNFPVYNVPALFPNGTDLTSAITILAETLEIPIYDEVVVVPVINRALYYPGSGPSDGPLIQAVTSWYSQQFTPTATGPATQAQLQLRTAGVPDFYMVMDIQTDIGGVPSGTVLATSQPVHAGQISGSFQETDFYFPTPPTLTASTNYHLVLRPLVTSAFTIDALDYVVIGVTAGAGLYPGHNPTSSTNSGSSWTVQTGYTQRFQVNDFTGQAINSVTGLPINSKTSMPESYVIGSSSLVVYVDGVLVQPTVDYTEITINSIQWLRRVEANSRIRFRIGNVGGASVATSGNSLQAAYGNGNTITTAPGIPVTISGAGGKLLTVNGDVDITGIIDPTAITFTPQSSSPIPGGQYGLWIHPTLGLMLESNLSGPLQVEQILDMASAPTSLTRTMTNGSGATIAMGTPVYIIGTGQVGPASAVSAGPSVAPFFGIAMTTMANGTSGPICYAGTAMGVLSGQTSGEYLWLQSTPGMLASTSAGDGYLEFIVGQVDGNDLILQPHFEGQG